MSWPTHQVSNQSPPLVDYNLFDTDPALREGLSREGAAWAAPALATLGAELGRADRLDLGRLANHYPPELRAFDQKGFRIDQVEFHPAWHALMQGIVENGFHSSPWAEPRPGAHVARAAGYLMQAQVESGSLCPTTMTYGSIPALAKHPQLARDWLSILYSRHYDPRDLPLQRKHGGLIGMGMTEKQGGSDVRSNATVAVADGEGWRLTGHKWFFSAPQCDAHLVLAQTEAGLSCFVVPRWQPDDSRNPVLIQRLKDKVGNRSNASSEVEFAGAWGWLLGEAGRGVATIIEMATYTRLDCVLGSTGLMRQALAQAVHHCRHRRAFGALLIEQPLMRSLLADLALEVEASIALALRMGRAFDKQDDPGSQVYRRVVTPVAKYWVCKRAITFAAEAMEVLGGNGYVEDGALGRLYREAPVNSIWEGSGNVMCLDLMRALAKEPEAVDILAAELERPRGRQAEYDRHLTTLLTALRRPDPATARWLTEQLALALQAGLLIEHAPEPIAVAFCRARLATPGLQFGALAEPAAVDLLLNRVLAGF
ncbi:isovaleryl-CoA dehydrogenase [Chitinimonas lacunae]|uniref:Isovaleryl-CoA dehydrogenase n=1 Tax=Chitinimonas lacunae TaxID=1963018 RepID=A0ABV8MTR7_9NEIS